MLSMETAYVLLGVSQIFLVVVILYQRATIKHLRRALLVWREDILKHRSKLNVRRFAAVDRAMQDTLDVIDRALKR